MPKPARFCDVLADKDKVQEVHDALFAAYLGFVARKATEGKSATAVDILMGFHNAYKHALIDLEKIIRDDVGYLRRTAVATLAMGLGVPIEVPGSEPHRYGGSVN